MQAMVSAGWKIWRFAAHRGREPALLHLRGQGLGGLSRTRGRGLALYCLRGQGSEGLSRIVGTNLLYRTSAARFLQVCRAP